MSDSSDLSSREEEFEDWDKDDPRRRNDQFAPPTEPCECYCLHCQRVFMSDGMWFQRVIGDPQGFEGFWMCATPNCDGKGFTFDIFPTDPAHPANAGWYDDDDEEFEEDYEFDEEFIDDFQPPEWDPQENQYRQADECDPDIEGDEWKYGLSPGEQRPEPDWAQQARLEREAEQRMYDEPDRRPREIDWTDRVDRHSGGSMSEDDIPF